MRELDLLQRIATSKLPFRLLTADDFSDAKLLMSSGYVKVSLPKMQNARGSFGKPEDAVVSAITPAGRRALAA